MSGRWLPAWRPLRAGDRVDVIAPASPAPDEMLAAGIGVLREWGLRVHLPEPLQDPKLWVAIDDRRRWQQLRTALLSRESAAVWCLRGGYGSLRLVPKLEQLRRQPISKPVIGFSDITALHGAVQSRWRMNPIHGAVLTQLRAGAIAKSDKERLRGLLFGELDEVRAAGLRPLNDSARQASLLEGPVIGGNLATLQSLCGTSIQPNGRGAIVFLEDVNERGYAVDRLLTTLRLSGVLRGARAVVFGDFLGGDESNGRNLVGDAISALADDIKSPVYSGLPVGHGRRLLPLVIGLGARIEPGTRGAVLTQRFRAAL
jgi:muramoyltetrapeptide carboxypeptidase